MAWNNASPQNSESNVSDQFYKFDALERINDYTEVTVRILDEAPENVWQHWFENRPYNCLGTRECPICAARNRSKAMGEDYKNLYRLSNRFMFNILVRDPKGNHVKILGFSNGLEKDLRAFFERYGDLRGYDVVIRKRKTGGLAMNVEYTIFKEDSSPLSADDQALVDAGRVDLTQFTQPGSMSDLISVAQGRTPVRDEQEVQGGGLNEFAGSGAGTVSATDVLMNRIEEIASSRGATLEDFGFSRNNPPNQSLLEGLLKSLEAN